MIGVLITGGPGVGKTSLLKEFGFRGLTTVGDTAREVIAERRGNGLTSRPPPLEFAEEILRRIAHSTGLLLNDPASCSSTVAFPKRLACSSRPGHRWLAN